MFFESTHLTLKQDFFLKKIVSNDVWNESEENPRSSLKERHAWGGMGSSLVLMLHPSVLALILIPSVINHVLGWHFVFLVSC